ncbi:butyrophilin-like protein 2 isoform X3 [Onychostoma macrolepis]|uniref:butyrophilin-like protein 2 isoform X3 n=1 Tax=Onychostoma macrolepis TaxID=369639 RepID=UPI00272A7F5E|nr:butyrophilin-like protein 2 isoform X3 [Onychostoma macrolepis]
MAARSGNYFQLVIPERGERVKVNSGSNLTVSCHLSPALSAVDMEITWFGEMSCVCAYKNREMTQGADYEGRASLFISDLPRGNVSLRVADFRESDLGVYMCRVSSRNETRQITVNVTEEVSAISKDQHFFTVNCKEERNELTPQDMPSHPNPQDNKLPGVYDNRIGNKSKNLFQASYKKEPNKSQQRDSKKDDLRDKNFQLVAPSPSEEPEVSLGSDLIIPCHLSPEISAVDLEIIWSNDTACVCLYEDRRVTEGALFKDRASLFTHKLREGDVSLRLKNFSLSDIGNYHCQVSSKDRRERVTVKVRINPGVQTVSRSPIYQDRNVPSVLHEDKKRRKAPNKSSRHVSQLSDSDNGIKWFKETDCVCIYKNGHVIEGRSYKDRASLGTHVLERGNVSLHLNNFSVSDVGDYCCQVTSRDTTKQITVGVRIKPEVQPVSQSPTSQGQSVQLMLFETDKIWTKEETDEMDKSALMAEMKVTNEQDTLLKAYIEKSRHLERVEEELRAMRMKLDRLDPHAQLLDRDEPDPF